MLDYPRQRFVFLLDWSFWKPELQYFYLCLCLWANSHTLLNAVHILIKFQVIISIKDLFKYAQLTSPLKEFPLKFLSSIEVTKQKQNKTIKQRMSLQMYYCNLVQVARVRQTKTIKCITEIGLHGNCIYKKK